MSKRSSRHHRALSEEEGSDHELEGLREGGRNGERERRRVDPVIKEAHKRGLDVELNGSRTPAWRNLRGRDGAAKKQSYFEGPEDEEDELADQPSDGEAAAGKKGKRSRAAAAVQEEDEDEDESSESSEDELEEEDEEDEDEDGEGQLEEEEAPRYSRRVRNTVQHYSPPNDPAPTGARGSGGGGSGRRRRSYQQDPDEEDSEEEDGKAAADEDPDRFALRYSVRPRRQVEFFNPVDGERGGSQQPASSGLPSRKRRDRDGRGGQHQRSDDDEPEERQPRREYSFRDRALVTIKPASKAGGGGSGGGGLYRSGSGRTGSGQHDRKRSRLHDHQRRLHGGARLVRPGRGRGDEDEIDNMDAEPHHSHHLTAAGGGGLYRSGAGGAGGGGPGGPPFDLLAAAGANLPLSHLGREKAGNAEITPLQVDPSVSFDTVGGLDHYIKALKEMIFLPLVYPELFERFHIAPPRGVLFYGPPGTGKTLVARALAAHAGRAGKKVSFFMRKGADVLSKWVGEAERQLRLLFEEAQRHQPSIIFFDEIDGLAPVRSSKSDQIHNSIVSTLLALMDGLDARGQVVVIGATNRVDALDGALRRPGRFDRELVFPLPNLTARADILAIHTSKWAEVPTPELLQELASLCVGYCGADLKAICTEASLASLRRHYPQIYDADDKLLIDPGRVRVQRRDFLSAFQTITPASHRSAAANARPLPPLVASVLLDHMQRILAQLQSGFPAAAACLRSGFGGGRNPAAGFSAGLDDEDDDLATGGASGSFNWASGASLGVQRPRLLICGPEGTGQAHLGPAVLYALEGLPVHAIGLPSLLSDAGARAPEEALVHAVVEARRAAPAVLFLPHLQVWWDTAPNSLRATLWMLLADLPADLPLLLFATADVPASELDPSVRQLFNAQSGGAYELAPPDRQQRSAFFSSLSEALALPPRPEAARREAAAAAPLPALPRAPEAAAAEAAAKKKAEELAARQRFEADQAVLRALRMTLRELTMQLLGAKKWELFWEPEEDPEWWDKVSSPMDLATILSRVDAQQYSTPQEYLADFGLIVQCSREYWGTNPAGVREISRACALQDEARAAVASAVPPELQARLEELLAQGGPAPAPPSLLALPGAAPPDGKTPGAHLLSRRPPSGRVQSDDPLHRRATRHAGGAGALDDRMLHTDPEAAARHIRALKKQQQEQLSQQQQEAEGQAHDSQQQRQQQQPEDALTQQQEQTEEGGEAAGGGMQEREVLVESTRENLPEPAAAAVAATPVADGAAAAAAAAKHAGKGTLTAVVQQLGGSRLRREGSSLLLQQAQEEVGEEQQEPAAEEEAAAGPAQPAKESAPAYEPSPADYARAEKLQGALVQQSEGCVLDHLETIHAKLSRLAVEQRRAQDREEVVGAALAAVREWRVARQQA